MLLQYHGDCDLNPNKVEEVRKEFPSGQTCKCVFVCEFVYI